MVAIKKYLHWRYIRWVLAAGIFVGLVVMIWLTVYFMRVTRDLPSVKTLSEYKPPIMTRVHAGDGALIAEYATQHRVFVPIEAIPKDIQHAFVAAEDQRFYDHDGFDEKGFARAMLANLKHKLKGERLEGGSTITQQVAKNFLVGSERTISRKVREIVIARRIEKALDKDHILELYLNEIYLGERAYGVAAAGLNYFGKSLDELSLSETAYLAALPKAPNNYDLERYKERAINRRNYVLSRLVEDGYVSQEAADAARLEDLVSVERLSGEVYSASDYFVEEIRKRVFAMYGQDQLYAGGLSIRTTLDTKLQIAGRRALRQGLEAYDKRYGYRGPLEHFDSLDNWQDRLDTFKAPEDIGDWRVALVLETTKTSATLGFAQDAKSDADTDTRPDNGTMNLDDMAWARPVKNAQRGPNPKAANDVVNVGDVILVQRINDQDNSYRLQQIPDVNGGLIAMDPHTGRILAIVGGYSFNQSQFNRTTQAYRQPGSAFKPFVYAAALDNGYTPASQVLDAPFVIKRYDARCQDDRTSEIDLRSADEDGQTATNNGGADQACERFYKPSNYAEGKFYGLSTLRLGLEKSRNAMTVRLANDIGMKPIMDYGRRFGIYDEPRPELAWALGAGETTLLRMAAAYSMMINGGKKITPRILDRVQDGQGHTIYISQDKPCEVCRVEEWDNSKPPELPDEREQIIDPVTAYQITYMMKGVVDNGTGIIIKSLGYPLGGKTGTTNDYMDAWFMGFSPDLVAGVYVGYDTPRSLNNEAGSKAAAPIFKAFMAEALKDKAKVPFRIPEGVTLSPVDRTTGEPSYIGASNFILEAFRPGTEPQLGELASTIRVGSGSDTFITGQTPEEFDDASSGSGAVDKSAENPGQSGAPDQGGNSNQPPQEPTPDDDLDDGLY